MSDLHTLNRIRRQRALQAAPFKVQTLNKDGSPSRMRDSVRGFSTEAQALDHVASVRSFNPGRTLRFSLNGVEI